MKLIVSIKAPKLSMAFKPPIARDYINADIYEGVYEVEPSAFNDIILPTENKVLVEDVTVSKIYYAEVTNPAMGSTVYIAEHI